MRSAAITAMLCIGFAAAAAGQDAKVTKGAAAVHGSEMHAMPFDWRQGNKKGPLDGVASKLSADDIRSWITDAKGMIAKTKPTRKPDMKAFTLPNDDVDALVAYLVTLKQ